MAKRLMVVDSSLATQKLIEFSLGKEGFEVTSFSDGLSALDAVEKVQPSLVVADYNLPGISIQRFCEKLKKQPGFHDRPILLMINYAETADREKLKQAGVTDFIKKPVEVTNLLEKIKTFSKGTEDSAEPTVSMFRPEVAQSTKEKEEMMKIEELLGWSIPPEQSFAGFAEPEKVETALEEKTIYGSPKEDIILVEEEHPPASPHASNELREPMLEIPLPEPSLVTSAPEPPAATTPPAYATMFPHVSIPPEPVTQEIIEQVAWETVPGFAESAVQKLTQELMQSVVNKLAKEIVEKVAWEVIPSLAEIAIQKEIEKLNKEE
ncbi:MAG TPA: response regulator [Nitrospiria bacterium]|jgi:twitching motility two-component system response regulator PilG|nr:response regulator [Nitrospiria bacterium]